MNEWMKVVEHAIDNALTIFRTNFAIALTHSLSLSFRLVVFVFINNNIQIFFRLNLRLQLPFYIAIYSMVETTKNVCDYIAALLYMGNQLFRLF